MGWFKFMKIKRLKKKRYTDKILGRLPVPLGLRTRPRTPHPRRRAPGRILRLGRLWSQVSHVPQATETGASHSWTYSGYHMYFRR